MDDQQPPEARSKSDFQSQYGQQEPPESRASSEFPSQYGQLAAQDREDREDQDEYLDPYLQNGSRQLSFAQDIHQLSEMRSEDLLASVQVNNLEEHLKNMRKEELNMYIIHITNLLHSKLESKIVWFLKFLFSFFF